MRNKIKNWFKALPCKVGLFLKNRWAYLLGVVFTWVVPIYLLNEIVALTKDVPAHFKITFMGCLVIIIVLLAFRKKLYAKIQKIPAGLPRGLLLTLHRAVLYGLVLGILWALSSFSGKFFDWWIYSGISMLFGAYFYCVDEYLAHKREMQEKEDSSETESN